MRVGVLPYPESVIDPTNFSTKKLGVKLWDNSDNIYIYIYKI